MTQIDKYNSAVNTFRGKFNAIPGDMRPEIASQFGFNTAGENCFGLVQGARNGDGLIDGVAVSLRQSIGETALFWKDISSPAAGSLIEGGFPNSGAAAINCATPNVMGASNASQYYPNAKIGYGNFLYVYETSGFNWYGISAITSVGSSGKLLSNAILSVNQAYKIDSKVDDGNPLSGNVLATYLNNSNVAVQATPNSSIPGGDSTSCYDTATGSYSISYNNGSGANCALSFKMQGAGP